MGETTSKSKVAVVRTGEDLPAALGEALDLLGGIQGLNTADRAVTIKVGVFDHRTHHHPSVEAVRAIGSAFDQAPCIRIAESDNYCGNALERLQRCYGELFGGRVTPCSLSGDPQAKRVSIAGEEMDLSPALLKPNVLVSAHVFRTFKKGSVLKNLFGCTPMVKKAKFHKNEVYPVLLADLFEACGGIDLAVLDGTYLYSDAADKRVKTDVLIVGRDAVAVEAVGAWLAGLKPESLPHLQEFVRRGLGVGDLDGIEIVGASGEDLARLKAARKELKALIQAAPRQPGISGTIDRLVEEGWLDAPRGLPEVVEALKNRGVNAKEAIVETTLKRRVGKTLERAKTGDGWVYSRSRD